MSGLLFQAGSLDGITIVSTSIRTKIRDCVDGYDSCANFWVRCLYEGEEGDPEDVEKGFLKSSLLIKV